ncbi:MAG TPA: hypothetical protein VK689_10420, partial [Armatimonadota bacterium]|nr:hypothetical protein [Armatimonadota bacterium]
MALGRPNLGSILTRNGVISQHQLDAAVRYQAEDGCRLGEALVSLGACTEVQIAQALAEQLELPFVDLHLSPPIASYTALIPRESALEYGVLPVRMQGNRLLVVARDPFDIRVDEMVRQATDMPVILGIAPESQLRELLHQFYKA